MIVRYRQHTFQHTESRLGLWFRFRFSDKLRFSDTVKFWVMVRVMVRFMIRIRVSVRVRVRVTTNLTLPKALPVLTRLLFSCE
jgi:hypothetical protein